MTTTLQRDKDEAVRPGGAITPPSRITGVLLGLLALAVGFGAGWLTFRDAGATGPSEVREHFEEYRDAWVANDGEAAVALMESNATFYSDLFPGGVSGERLAGIIETYPTAFIAEIEVVRIVGDDPYLVVGESPEYPGDYSVTHVADTDGELKILQHIWFDR